MSEGEFRIISPQDDPMRWDQFVNDHPKGTVFHLSSMLQSLEETPKHENLACAAIDEKGEVLALHPAIKVSTLEGMVSRVASRSICYAEPLCAAEPRGRSALKTLIQRHDRQMRYRTLFAEVRAISAPCLEQETLQQCNYEFRDYLNYLVDTSVETDTLWRKLSKSARSSISKTQRKGVEACLLEPQQGIERIYPLIVASYARSRVPLASIELFHSVLRNLPPEMIQIRVATLGDEDIAGGIGLIYRQRFFAWYGGSLRQAGVFPFDLLTWEEIRWCAENGIKLYDFGGAGWPDEAYGPRDFKSKFGGQLVHFGRYTNQYSRIRMAIANTAFEAVRGILAR